MAKAEGRHAKQEPHKATECGIVKAIIHPHRNGDKQRTSIGRSNEPDEKAERSCNSPSPLVPISRGEYQRDDMLAVPFAGARLRVTGRCMKTNPAQFLLAADRQLGRLNFSRRQFWSGALKQAFG